MARARTRAQARRGGDTHAGDGRATHLVRQWALLNQPRFERAFGPEAYRAALEACSAEGVAADGSNVAMVELRAEMAALAAQLFVDRGPSRARLTQAFRLEGDRLAASALTNIKEHLVSHVKRFVNAVHGVKQQQQAAVGRAARQAVGRRYGLVKAALVGT